MCVSAGCSCVSVCVWGGVLCVKDSAICEHVYAPLSLNLYMFEWQAATKNIHVWMHNMLVVWQYTQVNKNVTWRDSVCHPQAVAPLCQQGAALLDQCEAVVQVRCEPRGRMPLCFSHTVSQPVTYLRLLAQWTPKEECVANLKHAVCLLVVKAVWRTWLELHFMTGSPFLMCHISVC